MGWWLTLIGLVLIFIGGGFSLAGFIISPQNTVITTIRNFFSETQSIKVLPPGLGGNDQLNLDNIATLQLHVPYTDNSVTLLLDVVTTSLAATSNETITVEGVKVYNHNSGTTYLFDTNENKRHRITVGERTFVVTLLKIKMLDVPNVPVAREYEFGITEE